MLDDETRVAHPLLAPHPFQVALPALPVGRIGEHEVELPTRKGVVGQGGVLWTPLDVVGPLALPLEQQVGLADRVGLGVDLLTVEVGGDRFAPLTGQLLQGLLSHGQHPAGTAGTVFPAGTAGTVFPAGTAGTVIEQVGAGLDPISYWKEDQLGHQLNGVTGVQCSPASSLFSSLKRRTSSSKMVPIRDCQDRAA